MPERPVRHLSDLDREKPEIVQLHRSTLLWGSIAFLLLWLASLGYAHECGRADEATLWAGEANEARVEASR